MDSIRNRIKGILDAVGEQMLAAREPVEPVKICASDYAFSEKFDPADHVWRDFGRDETWGGKDLHYWFLAAVTVTAAMDGRQIRVILNTGATDIWNTDNPQVMAYVDGRLAGTMDLNHQERFSAIMAGWGIRMRLVFMRIRVRRPTLISFTWMQPPGARRPQGSITI